MVWVDTQISGSHRCLFGAETMVVHFNSSQIFSDCNFVVGGSGERSTQKEASSKGARTFDIVKEEAYDRLAHCDGSGGYAALHLRDDVGHAMYPSNQRERLFMFQHVWPRVIIEVRADNRVRKFRKAADGKQLEHWDLNTNSKCGWQQRKRQIRLEAKSLKRRLHQQSVILGRSYLFRYS